MGGVVTKTIRGACKVAAKSLFPKLIVMIAHEGKFEEFADAPQYAAFEPLVAWIPEVRLPSRERLLARESRGHYKLLSKVWSDVVTPI